jgi:hypothetical protein
VGVLSCAHSALLWMKLPTDVTLRDIVQEFEQVKHYILQMFVTVFKKSSPLDSIVSELVLVLNSTPPRL